MHSEFSYNFHRTFQSSTSKTDSLWLPRAFLRLQSFTAAHCVTTEVRDLGWGTDALTTSGTWQTKCLSNNSFYRSLCVMAAGRGSPIPQVLWNAFSERNCAIVEQSMRSQKKCWANRKESRTQNEREVLGIYQLSLKIDHIFKNIKTTVEMQPYHLILACML